MSEELQQPHSMQRGSLPDDKETLWREAVILLLAFKRFSVAQIALALGVQPEAIEELRQQPETRETLVDLRRLMPKPRDVNDLLADDADRNVRWLKRLRQGRVDGVTLGTDPKTLRVRQRAAEVLLDRQVPRKVALAVTANAPKTLDITPTHIERMRGLLEGPAKQTASEDEE